MAGSKAHKALAQKLKTPVRTSTALRVESCVTCERPSRIAGSRRRAGESEERWLRFHFKSTKITPKNESAFMRKTQPELEVAAIINPARAGPTARAMLKAAALRATAGGKQRSLTISGVIACQAGSFITAPSPMRNVKNNTMAGETVSRMVRMASIIAATTIHDCV